MQGLLNAALLGRAEKAASMTLERAPTPPATGYRFPAFFGWALGYNFFSQSRIIAACFACDLTFFFLYSQFQYARSKMLDTGPITKGSSPDCASCVSLAPRCAFGPHFQDYEPSGTENNSYNLHYPYNLL